MKMRLTLLSAAAALMLTGTAQAGFYFEGLQPYSESYCNGADGKDQPWIAPPPGAWEESSPDESSLGGRQAWDADCSKLGKGGKAPSKPAKPAPAAVPQK